MQRAVVKGGKLCSTDLSQTSNLNFSSDDCCSMHNIIKGLTHLPRSRARGDVLKIIKHGIFHSGHTQQHIYLLTVG